MSRRFEKFEMMINLKLNSLSHIRLSEKEAKQIKGGAYFTTNCSCACAYVNSGGSDSDGNGQANDKLRLDSNAETKAIRMVLKEFLD